MWYLSLKAVMYVRKASSLSMRESGTTYIQRKETLFQTHTAHTHTHTHTHLQYISVGARESAEFFVNFEHVVSNIASCFPQPLAYHIPTQTHPPAADERERGRNWIYTHRGKSARWLLLGLALQTPKHTHTHTLELTHRPDIISKETNPHQ